MITLVTGGVRSGKSLLAEKLTLQTGLPCLYVATAEPCDGEMNQRIINHQNNRDEQKWHLIEEPLLISKVLNHADWQYYAVLVDCITVWLCNLMHYGHNINSSIDEFLQSVANKKNLTIVTNETGMGVVPEHAMGREFRDYAGILNQRLAQIADNVIVMISGLPLTLKENISHV